MEQTQPIPCKPQAVHSGDQRGGLASLLDDRPSTLATWTAHADAGSTCCAERASAASQGQLSSHQPMPTSLLPPSKEAYSCTYRSCVFLLSGCIDNFLILT